MHQRGAGECNYENGELPTYTRDMIVSFLQKGVARSDILFWKVLGLTRREEGAAHLVEEVRKLPPRESQRLFRVAAKWLPTVEYGMFLSKVKSLKEKKIYTLQIKAPFGRIKRVQVFLKNVLRPSL